VQEHDRAALAGGGDVEFDAAGDLYALVVEVHIGTVRAPDQQLVSVRVSGW
jgi:hypothetical protein